MEWIHKLFRGRCHEYWFDTFNSNLLFKFISLISSEYIICPCLFFASTCKGNGIALTFLTYPALAASLTQGIFTESLLWQDTRSRSTEDALIQIQVVQFRCYHYPCVNTELLKPSWRELRCALKRYIYTLKSAYTIHKCFRLCTNKALVTIIQFCHYSIKSAGVLLRQCLCFSKTFIYKNRQLLCARCNLLTPGSLMNS